MDEAKRIIVAPRCLEIESHIVASTSPLGAALYVLS
jgi:hypothetical protein